jgi:hypothetical protein
VGRKRIIADPVKVTLNLHREDYEAMKSYYPSATAAVAIRALVHQHVQSLRQRISANTETLVPALELDLDEVDG